MESRKAIDIAILGAVPGEIKALLPRLSAPYRLDFLGQTFWTGAHGGARLLLGTTGLGKVSAAAMTATLLQRFSVAQVWNIGSAGAYAEGPLETGDVLIAEKAICGDEGILSRNGVSPVSEIGIPIAVRGPLALYDEIPFELRSESGAVATLTPPGLYCLEKEAGLQRAFLCAGSFRPSGEEHGSRHVNGVECMALQSTTETVAASMSIRDTFQLVYGPSLTVGMSSGDSETARERFRRYKAYAENMEGSAVAQTCFLFDVPMLECRGISNMAGDRNRENWQLEEALAHCHGILLTWLESALPLFN